MFNLSIALLGLTSHFCRNRSTLRRENTARRSANIDKGRSDFGCGLPQSSESRPVRGIFDEDDVHPIKILNFGAAPLAAGKSVRWAIVSAPLVDGKRQIAEIAFDSHVDYPCPESRRRVGDRTGRNEVLGADNLTAEGAAEIYAPCHHQRFSKFSAASCVPLPGTQALTPDVDQPDVQLPQMHGRRRPGHQFPLIHLRLPE